MRVTQYKILNNILNHLRIPNYIYAFEKNKSIPQMATLHTNKEVILSVDIKDFFHSIKQVRLQELFGTLGMGEKAARTLSELCTMKSFVPQGALTSPKVANLVTALSFGPPLKRYCDEQGLTLSIYADDVTISSTNPALEVGAVLGFVTNAIREAGFRVNYEKTKVMWKSQRQYVCGVVVNEKTNMLKKERYRLRAIVHNIIQNGLEIEALKFGVPAGTFASHVRGRLNWFKQLNDGLANKYVTQLENYLKAHSFSTTMSNVITTSENQAQPPVQTEGSQEASVPW